MKKTDRKLSLATETIRALASHSLRDAYGALSGKRGATTRDLPCPDTMQLLNTCGSAADDSCAYPSLGC